MPGHFAAQKKLLTRPFTANCRVDGPLFDTSTTKAGLQTGREKLRGLWPELKIW